MELYIVWHLSLSWSSGAMTVEREQEGVTRGVTALAMIGG